jgi:hypothetical protein
MFAQYEFVTESDVEPNWPDLSERKISAGLWTESTNKENSVVLSPLANYTDRAIAAGQRS